MKNIIYFLMLSSFQVSAMQAENNNAQATRFFFERGGPSLGTALHKAVLDEDLDEVKKIIATLQQEKSFDIQQFLAIRDRNNNNAKYIANKLNNKKIITYLDSVVTNKKRVADNNISSSCIKKPSLATNKSRHTEKAENLFGVLANEQDFYCNKNLYGYSKEISYIPNIKFNKETLVFNKFIQNINSDNNSLLNIYYFLEYDMKKFFEYLASHDFSRDEINHVDIDQSHNNISTVVNRYVKILATLFQSNDSNKKLNFLFNSANKFFDFCFRDPSAQVCRDYSLDDKYHPIMRLMFSVMFNNLTHYGWKDWSRDALLNIYKEHDKGKRVHYIGGGFDIFSLLDEGIYNITIVDPFIPAQKSFYPAKWEWILDGGEIGDVIKFENQKICLVRRYYSKDGTFDLVHSQEGKITLPRSVTIWQVYDSENKKTLGTIEFQRRLCDNNDFLDPNQEKILLMSLNELHFISAFKKNGGWGLDHRKLPINLNMNIKQLHKSIDRNCIVNMRKLSAKFQFCDLGVEYCNLY
jgi:hypothetical protein